MINALQDGFSNFQIHFWMVICILLILIWGQLVMQKILSKVFGNSFTEVEYFSLSLAGWMFPVMVWSAIYFLTYFFLGKIFSIIISALLFLLPIFWIRFKKPSLPVVALILFLLLSIFIRLVFLQQALLPAYFDSAEHYLNIQHLINSYESGSFSIFRSNYYHLGYHFLIAALIHLFQFNITDFMLVFGQVVLSVLPISFFFLLKQITGSNTVAFFTCLIAGLGFHMPAHLINWGKYPALLGLAGIQFVFCLGYLRYKNNLLLNQKLTLSILITISMLITVLMHSRTLIIFVLFIIAYFIVQQFKRVSHQLQLLLFVLIIIGLGVEIFYIRHSPVLFPLLDRYLQNDIWVLIFIILTIPFSIKTYPSLTFFLLTSLCLFMFFLFLPISLLNYGTQTLLDRPFVQILTYFPLSIFAGLGFSELYKASQNFPSFRYLIIFISFGLILINTNFNHNFYPLTCCQIVNRDDLLAIEWIEK